MGRDHAEDLRNCRNNGFVALEEAISALREHINVVKKEHQKIDINEIELMSKRVEDSEKECKINSDIYIKYLQDNQR
jgi:hypothetical protein